MPSKVERTTLSVKDFGPIAQAEIDLRPFTVFVGASNTGKSYLAILLYALHRFFNRPGVASGFLSRRETTRHGVSGQQAEAINQWLQQNETAAKREAGVALPDDLAVLVRPILRRIGESSALLDEEVKRCFGLEQSADLIRQPAGRCARVTLRRRCGDDCTSWPGYDFAISRKNARLSSSFPANMPLRARAVTRRQFGLQLLLTRHRARKLLHPTELTELADLTVPFTAGSVVRPVYYLPADRGGVMHMHRTFASSLISNASLAALRVEESPLPPLSGVLVDFLVGLINLDEKRKSTGSDELAGRLEAEILGGSVRIRESAFGYPSFHYQPESWQRELALMNTSSMVSELAPVVLYLRHIVRKGDVIIIEEPESHLHPQMQIAFTRFLAAVVKAGIRVIVTTHSEWVLEALANLVRLSDVPKSRRSKVDAGGPALTPDEVGAWLFEPKLRPKGSVVKEIPLDTVRGTFPAGFGDITENLYNDWATITNSLQDPA